MKENKKYIALFKGINVGGKNIVKMAELKEMFINLEFQNVQTYIQSGNVIFDTNKKDIIEIKEIINNSFKKKFTFNSDVILFSQKDFINIIDNLPFSQASINQVISHDNKVEHLYVYMFNDEIDITLITTIQNEYSGKDQLVVIENALYLLCYDSVRNSKLAQKLTKVKIALTSRNWKTMNKLYKMIKETP